eukprot:1138547-Pelagomonas_calceolata.AAC.3
MAEETLQHEYLILWAEPAHLDQVLRSLGGQQSCDAAGEFRVQAVMHVSSSLQVLDEGGDELRRLMLCIAWPWKSSTRQCLGICAVGCGE